MNNVKFFTNSLPIIRVSYSKMCTLKYIFWATRFSVFRWKLCHVNKGGFVFWHFAFNTPYNTTNKQTNWITMLGYCTLRFITILHCLICFAFHFVHWKPDPIHFHNVAIRGLFWPFMMRGYQVPFTPLCANDYFAGYRSKTSFWVSSLNKRGKKPCSHLPR